MIDPVLVVTGGGVLVLCALGAMVDIARHPHCPKCAHCRQEAWMRDQEKARRIQLQRDLDHQTWHRAHGELITQCPFCEEDQDRGGKIQ